ncbi:hypothetical protein [Brevibacterium oceani]|uniref:hypothetical protein n=1 Tax=Brevibacterium oceani TaxID=358099 RepID=UPI001B33DF13|nr:hypothetical protein [Brevibacterium oceani]
MTSILPAAEPRWEGEGVIWSPGPLDHDADIHRRDLQRNGRLTIPVLSSGGAAQALAVNYLPMCEGIAEEKPKEFVDLFLEFDAGARAQ